MSGQGSLNEDEDKHDPPTESGPSHAFNALHGKNIQESIALLGEEFDRIVSEKPTEQPFSRASEAELKEFEIEHEQRQESKQFPSSDLLEELFREDPKQQSTEDGCGESSPNHLTFQTVKNGYSTESEKLLSDQLLASISLPMPEHIEATIPNFVDTKRQILL
jgi:hypothetical protein